MPQPRTGSLTGLISAPPATIPFMMHGFMAERLPQLCLLVVLSVTAWPTYAFSDPSVPIPSGQLLIESLPPGAEVTLDGASVPGVTPIHIEAIPSGQHEVVLKHPTFPGRREGRTVHVSPNDLTRVTVSFLTPTQPVPKPLSTSTEKQPPKPTPPPPLGSLRVESDPAGATVSVDGVEKGRSPLDARALSAGPHEVTVDRPGGLSRTVTVYVKAGETVTTSVSLRQGRRLMGTSDIVLKTALASLLLICAVLTTAILVVRRGQQRRRGKGIGRTAYRFSLLRLKRSRRGRYPVIDGFALERELGAGGMATVYKAIAHGSDKPVAIKVPRERFQRNGAFIQRFRSRAELGRRLNHPNIVQIYSVGQTPKGLHFLVMEFINGVNLNALIRSGLGTDEAIDIALDVCRALKYAHDRDVIHCDIKPGNVMVEKGERNRVVLMDFDGAQLLSSDNSLVRDFRLLTPGYTAPEIANREQPTPASDLYAVGAMLFEMLTGKKLVEFKPGDSPHAILHRQVQQTPRAPSSVKPGIPESLDNITVGLVARQPEARPKHVDDVIAALQDAKRSQTVQRGQAPRKEAL